VISGSSCTPLLVDFLICFANAREHAEQMDNSYGSLRFEEVVQPKRKVFARFTKLRHLSLLDDDCNCTQSNVSGLLPALHGMTQLTFLEVGNQNGRHPHRTLG
jgi:hypothetical protein